MRSSDDLRSQEYLFHRDNEHDSGVIKVWARRLQVPASSSSLTIPVSWNITTEQVITEALARFRLEDAPISDYQLVKVTLEAGRGQCMKVITVLAGKYELSFLLFQSPKLFSETTTFLGTS